MASKKSQAPQKYHHGDLRRTVMDAALQMAATSGLESLSLREIARKIGVTTAAPYYHFRDRQTLLLDLAIEAYGKLLEVLKRAREAAGDPEEQVVAAVTSYLRFGRNHRAEYVIMFAGEFSTHPRVGEMVIVANACLDLVRRSIAEASGLGDRESSEAAFCAWSLLHGILQLDQKGVLQELPDEQDRLAVQGVLGIVNGFGGRDSATR